MKLRDYQQRISDAVIHEFESVNSTLVVAPTGCGKTRIFADIVKRMQPGRSLILAHRKELIWQAHNRITEWTGLGCEVEMADLHSNETLFGRAPVVIGSIQTQISGPADGRKRMSRFNPNDFSLLVLDEVHHATSDSYRDVINYYRQNPKLKLLGVTATPDRADEEALGQILETVAADYELLDAIDEGWLVDIAARYVQVAGLDYSGIRTTAGDLNGGDLAAVMEAEEIVQRVVQPSLEAMFRLPEHTLARIAVTDWQSYLANQPSPRRTIVFCASKRHAEMMCEVFNRSIPGKCGWVCDSTPADKRAQLLKDFSQGPIYAVCNVGILTEGYDNPFVELVVMSRATKSRSLFSQMVGRATRPLPGLVDPLPTPAERVNAIKGSSKPTCVVMDLVGNTGRHKLVTAADMLGGKVSDKAIEKAQKIAEKLGTEVPMRETLKRAQLEVLEEEKAEREREEARRRARLIVKVDYRVKYVNPFNLLDIQPVVSRGWDRGKTLSEKQRNLLRRQGLDPDMPYAEARVLIGELFNRWRNNLCTIGQCKVLKRFGLPTNITKTEASKLIDQLAANNWHPLPKPQVAA